MTGLKFQEVNYGRALSVLGGNFCTGAMANNLRAAQSKFAHILKGPYVEDETREVIHEHFLTGLSLVCVRWARIKSKMNLLFGMILCNEI